MRAVSSNSCASRRSPRGIVSVPSASTRLSLATVSSARSSIPHDSRARRRSAGGSAGCTAWRFAACRSVRMYLIRSLAARPSRTNAGSSSPEAPVVAMMRRVLVTGVQCCTPGTAAVGGFPATRAAHALRTIERWIAMLPLWRRTRAAREPDGDVNFDVLGDRDIDAAPVRDAVQTKLGPIDLECRFEAVVPDGDRHVDAPRHVADRQIAGHGDRAVRAHDRRGADESHRRILIDVEELAGLEQLNVIGILHVDAAREDRELDMRVRRPRRIERNLAGEVLELSFLLHREEHLREDREVDAPRLRRDEHVVGARGARGRWRQRRECESGNRQPHSFHLYLPDCKKDAAGREPLTGRRDEYCAPVSINETGDSGVFG